MSNFHTTLFQNSFVLIRHNIGNPNKYIFDIPIPFCHNLSATFKQFLTEFAGTETVDHIIYI